jgi:long-chain acyl-CoA synthetase
MLIRIVQEGWLRDFDISSLRRLTYGSVPMDAVWIRRTMEAFPAVGLVHSYGLTETSPILTILGWNHHWSGPRMRSGGRPLSGVDLRILGEDGNGLPPGEAGEIVVRDRNV